MDKKILKNIKLGFIIAIIFLAISPFLFTRTCGLFSFNNETGVVGDTIGGITAPIASLIGSVLVFFALQAQIEANKMIFEQFENQKEEELFRKLNSYISEQIKLIREDIQEISITERTTKGNNKEEKDYKGVEGIMAFLETVSVMKHQTSEEDIIDSLCYLSQIKLILERVEYLLIKCENEKLKKEDANYLRGLISYTYQYKLKVPLREFEQNRMSKVEPCINCGKKHNGIPEVIYELYDKINEKCLLL